MSQRLWGTLLEREGRLEAAVDLVADSRRRAMTRLIIRCGVLRAAPAGSSTTYRSSVDRVLAYLVVAIGWIDGAAFGQAQT